MTNPLREAALRILLELQVPPDDTGELRYRAWKRLQQEYNLSRQMAHNVIRAVQERRQKGLDPLADGRSLPRKRKGYQKYDN